MMLRRFSKKTIWFLFAKVLIMGVAIVFAATVNLTSNTYQTQVGTTLQVTSGIVAIDKGFTLATSTSSATGTSCSSPVTFTGSPRTASTGVTQGHMFYDVQVNSTTTATANQKFNVTLFLAGTTYGPLCIQPPSSPQNAQTIDCKFDVGTSLPAAPYSFKVTVQ